MADVGSGSLARQLADAEAAAKQAAHQTSSSSGDDCRNSQVRDRFSQNAASEVGSGSAKSLPKSLTKNSNASSGRSHPSAPSSILQNPGAKNSQVGSVRSNQSAPNSSLSGESATNLEELQQKVKNLTQALADRDSQQALLLQKVASMEKTRAATEAKHTVEIGDAREALQVSQDERDGLENQIAGQHARQKKRDRNEEDRKTEDKVTKDGLRAQGAEDVVEIKELTALLAAARGDAAEEAVLQSMSDSAQLVETEQLKEVVASLTGELKLQKSAGNSADGGMADEHARLQQKIIDINLQSQKQNKEMSELRLDMLGFKKSNMKQKATIASMQKGGHNRPVPARRAATNLSLSSIDEEEDPDSLDTMSDYGGISGSVSDCVSSDAGEEELGMKKASRGVDGGKVDATASKAPPMASAEQLRIEEDLRVEHAEQLAMITRLQDLLQNSRDSSQLLRDDMAFIKSNEALDAIANLNQIDALQLSLRSAATRDLNQELMIETHAAAAGQMQEDAEIMYGGLCKTKEALRVALIRIEDFHAELENQRIKHERELLTLRNAGHAPPGPDSPEQTLLELQQDRSLLADQLQAQETQFRLERDEAQLHHNAEILGMKRDYEIRILEYQRERDHDRSLVNTALASETADTASASASMNDRNNGEEKHTSRQIKDNCLTGCFSKMNDAVWQSFSDPAPAQDTSVPTLKQSHFCWAGACWELLNTNSSITALSLTFPELEIVKVSKAALAQFGPHLHGMSFLSIFPSQKQMMIRRATNIHQGLADDSGKGKKFICRELGTFDLSSPGSPTICASGPVVMAHLPAEEAYGTRRSLLVLIFSKVEGTSVRSGQSSGFGSLGPRGGLSSTCGSDIVPDDSISMQGGSVGHKRSKAELRMSQF